MKKSEKYIERRVFMEIGISTQLFERLQRDMGWEGGHSRQGNQSKQRYQGISRNH